MSAGDDDGWAFVFEGGAVFASGICLVPCVLGGGDAGVCVWSTSITFADVRGGGVLAGGGDAAARFTDLTFEAEGVASAAMERVRVCVDTRRTTLYHAGRALSDTCACCADGVRWADDITVSTMV